MPIARHVALGILFTTSWANGWTPGVATPMPATNLSVNTASRNDVLSFYQNIYQASENYATAINLTYSVETCAEGTLPAAYTTLMQRRVNYFRALAGVPATISMNNASTVVTTGDPYAASAATTKTLAAQKAALILSRNNTLTHQPPTNLSCFTSAGGNGCYFGNIAYGVYGPPALDAYMREDVNNQEAGHRRWILYDSATNFATGDIPRSGSYPATNTLYISQRSVELASVSPAFIAWPTSGFFPWQHATTYWSLSYPGGNFTNATITVTKDGVAQTVDSINRTQGYGNNGIVWRVPNMLTGGPDASYDVTVSNIGGGGPTSHSYRITFFSANHLLTPPTLSGTLTVDPGGSRNFLIGPVDVAEEYQLEVGKKNALPSSTVEGGEDATASFIIPGPVTGTGYNLRSTTYKRTGSKSLNLAYTNVSQNEQWVEFDRVLLPKTNASISYYRKLSFVNSDTTFVAQYCLNNDGQWIDIPGTARAGTSTNQETEANFTAQLTYALPGATLNQPTRVRLLLRKTLPQGFITNSTAVSGAFIDDVTFTNVDWLSTRRLTSYPANSSSVTLNATTAGETLSPGNQYTLRLQPRIGNVWMTASPMMTAVVSNNAAPTLNTIASPVNLLEDANTHVISLAGISAGQSESQALTVTASSSNTSLIPHPAVTYTSPNSTGSLSFKPLANQSGTATITVTVNDGQASNNTIVQTFTVQVAAVNDPPVISAIAPLSINQNATANDIPVTVDDVDHSPAVLQISTNSSNPNLVTNNLISVTGTGNNRSLAIQPLANASGQSTITVTVNDGELTESTNFQLTVTAPEPVGFDAWVQNTYPQLAGSAFDADFDKDGIANGIEYAFSLNPTTVTQIPPLQVDPLARTMTLVMPLPAMRDGITYSAEYTETFDNWKSNHVVILVENGFMKATCPMGDFNRYLRWKITKN